MKIAMPASTALSSMTTDPRAVCGAALLMIGPLDIWAGLSSGHRQPAVTHDLVTTAVTLGLVATAFGGICLAIAFLFPETGMAQEDL